MHITLRNSFKIESNEIEQFPYFVANKMLDSRHGCKLCDIPQKLSCNSCFIIDVIINLGSTLHCTTLIFFCYNLLQLNEKLLFYFFLLKSYNFNIHFI